MLDRWLALIARVTETPRHDAARAVFDDLHTRYTAADRRYHDIHHINDCLQLFDKGRALVRNPMPSSLRSGSMMRSMTATNPTMRRPARAWRIRLMQLGVPRATRQSVCDLILATQHNAPPADPDAALLVDIDLSILGEPAPKFDAYEAGVRFEYAWVTESAFRAGRSQVLQSFLDRPRIFTTDYFGAAFEIIRPSEPEPLARKPRGPNRIRCQEPIRQN